MATAHLRTQLRSKITAAFAGTDAVISFSGRADERQAEAFTPAETGEAVAADELRSLIERIERIDEERRALGEDRRDVLREAKGRGFSTKAITALVRLRSIEPHERAEQEATLDLYKSALGMT